MINHRDILTDEPFFSTKFGNEYIVCDINFFLFFFYHSYYSSYTFLTDSNCLIIRIVSQSKELVRGVNAT